MNEGPIKVGRINRAIEKTVGADLGEDVAVYLEEEELNALVKKKPDSYLKAIEEEAVIIKKPDYACYSKEEESLFLFRQYLSPNGFVNIALVIKKEERWKIAGLFPINSERFKSISAKGKIIRVVP